jgi:hypothetical protein
MATLYPADYDTLTAVLTDKAIGASKTSDNPMLRRFIRQASRLWDLWTTRTFVPYMATKKYGMTHVSDVSLKLRDDLLEVTTLTNADGSVVTGSLYNLRPDNVYPKRTIELTTVSGTYWRFVYPEDRVQVAGVWGYHENYTQAWGNSLDTVQDNPLSSSATTLTVADVSGTDDRGYTRFEVGDYLKIESEYLQIVDIPTAFNTKLTVLRGANGSTAAIHAQNTAIYVYRQMDDVRFAVREITKWMYEHRDQVNQGVQLTQDLGIVIQNDLPEIKALAEHYVVDNSAGMILAV